ncbi:hypothetical protein HY971_03200 [Candidatus Kaiserbacteria bacterium]|nr:hypothetical protein [Candidatus Kaiserbacteria bacterium]
MSEIDNEKNFTRRGLFAAGAAGVAAGVLGTRAVDAVQNATSGSTIQEIPQAIGSREEIEGEWINEKVFMQKGVRELIAAQPERIRFNEATGEIHLKGDDGYEFELLPKSELKQVRVTMPDSSTVEFAHVDRKGDAETVSIRRIFDGTFTSESGGWMNRFEDETLQEKT